MGLSKDYSKVPAWKHKATGYKTGEKVKSQGNIFMAHFWASSDPKDAIDPNKEGWRLYDELYDVTTTKKTERANIIAYIPTWRKKEGFKYDNEEMYRYITHGIIAFLMFSESHIGEFESKSLNDVNLIISDVVSTGHRNNTKILIALGGATDYGFLRLMERVGNNPADPILSQTVQKVVDFVKLHNLDGVDLDLECWWDKNSDSSKDQGGRPKSEGPHPAGRGLTEFAKQLKKAMPDQIFSAAVFATSWYGNNYDPELVNYLDWVGIMSYDLTGSWNASPVGPHTAIDQIRKQEPYIEEQQGEWPGGGNANNPILSVEESLWYWTNPFFTNWQGKGQNLKRNKIALGVPIYGYDFAYGKEPDDLSGQIAPGYKSIRYKDILSQFPDAHTAKNANIKVPGNTPRPPFVSAPGTYPYAHNIYFETPKTATDKLKFLKSVGAQGVIIWELSNDVWEEGKSIIKALYQNSGNPTTKVPPLLSIALKEDVSSVEEGSIVGDGNFGKGDRYDTGIKPDVALNDGNVVVEVHQSQAANTLWYHVGKVEDDKINWGGSIKYDNGIQPSVAITNDGLVVEVHKSENFDTLYYHVGRVDGDKINWGKSHKYDDGVQPSVAITNDGLVVEVHKSQSHDTLWYHGTGQVNNNTIDWDNEKSQNYSDGKVPKVACNGQLAVETHNEGSDKLLCSVLTLPAFRSHWIELHGDNSYSYCVCNRATDNKHRHASNHTMNVKEGAPYLYAVLTKDDDSSNFPTGAIMTIEGPDGTKYDRDIEEENQLVIMSGSSVRCLIVKDPKPGEWKMTMTVPEGVGFHCECNTVPTTDVYDTMTDTLENPLQKRFLSFPAPVTFTGLGSILTFEASVPFWGWAAAGLTIAVALGINYVRQSNGKKRPLDKNQQAQRGNGITKKLKNAGSKSVTDTTKKLQDISSLNSNKKNKEDKPIALLTWNFEGANWDNINNSPWYKVKDWFTGYAQREGPIPYKFVVACLQECGTPPDTATLERQDINGITGLNSYFWAPQSDRFDLYLYILYYEWDMGGHRVNLAIASTIGVDTIEFIQPVGPNLRPLIGVKNMDSFFFSIHAASGTSQGGDAWPLLQRVSNQVNNVSWWVAGDYNQDPALLRTRLQSNNVDVTVCPPDRVTRPASNAMLDYAVRDTNANEITGNVPDFVGARYSDHLPVVYVLEEN